LVRYALAMDSVRRRSPSDREAAIFYALALIAVGQANATDTTFTYQKRADSILEPLFRREPRHPGLAHYLIHTNDVPQLAQHGLYAARRYAEIAPGVPHAQHMPSHIFTRLGLWDDDIAANTRRAARRSPRARVARRRSDHPFRPRDRRGARRRYRRGPPRAARARADREHAHRDRGSAGLLGWTGRHPAARGGRVA